MFFLKQIGKVLILSTSMGTTSLTIYKEIYTTPSIVLGTTESYGLTITVANPKHMENYPTT